MEQKILKCLEDIKKLTVLGLMKNGVQGRDIAISLGIDPATLSRMIPARKLKRGK